VQVQPDSLSTGSLAAFDVLNNIAGKKDQYASLIKAVMDPVQAQALALPDSAPIQTSQALALPDSAAVEPGSSTTAPANIAVVQDEIYPQNLFGISAQISINVLDQMVMFMEPEVNYSGLLLYAADQFIGAFQRLNNPYGAYFKIPTVNGQELSQADKDKTFADSLSKLEEAFKKARVYQDNDKVTFDNITNYFNLYAEAKIFIAGTDEVNNLFFQALCLYHNIFPELVDGTSLFKPLTPSQPLKRSLFKGRYVVASSQDIVDDISVFLDDATFDREKRDTELCDIMKKENSDKSTVHNYTKMYHFLLKEKRETAKNVFEIGIGAIDPSIPYTMGATGTAGASLRGWCDYFPNAHIYGADIAEKELLNEGRISTYYVDQLQPDVINTMFESIPTKGLDAKQFDVIIDDGLHCFEANHKFFLEAIKRLATGGVYIIEDIAPRGVPLILKLLADIDLNAALIKLPTTPARFDNTIFVVWK
jgi:SAM-dependent methyltransferase